jgi:hypothetical protein
MPRSPRERELTEDWLAPARAALPKAEWEAAYASATELSPAAAIAELCSLDVETVHDVGAVSPNP